MKTNQITFDGELRQAAENAVIDLVQVQHEVDRSMITLPIWLPTGSAASVYIWRQGSHLRVSDGRETYLQAEEAGGQRSFAKQAAKLAEAAGLKYELGEIFLDGVSFDNVAGAVSIVAEVMKKAFDATAEKMAERRASELNDRLYLRLVDLFSPRAVARDVPFSGASTHEWHFGNMVSIGRQYTLFEYVGPAHISVISASAKFHDVKELDNPPRRAAVVENREELGDLVGVLARAANVIELGFGDAQYKRLVA